MTLRSTVLSLQIMRIKKGRRGNSSCAVLLSLSKSRIWKWRSKILFCIIMCQVPCDTRSASVSLRKWKAPREASNMEHCTICHVTCVRFKQVSAVFVFIMGATKLTKVVQCQSSARLTVAVSSVWTVLQGEIFKCQQATVTYRIYVT